MGKSTMANIKESDWKIFKKIKEEAINQYCENCLSEYADIIAGSSKSVHEKYLYLYRIVENNNKKMDLIFGDRTSRSKAFLQLLAMRGESLANQELVSQLSPEFQEMTSPERVTW